MADSGGAHPAAHKRHFGHAIGDGGPDAAQAPDGDAGETDAEEAMALLRADIIGSFRQFEGPFGPRRVVYADWTASGRALRSVEAYMAEEVLPWYGNTHTTTSVTGLQSTWYRQEARQLVHHCCGGTEDDVVLFAGCGATAALAKLAAVLSGAARSAGGGTVFVGPFEHHSNILPWREGGEFEVVVIAEDASGRLDAAHLERELAAERERRGAAGLLVGAFSAASNVTGVLTDTDAIGAVLRRYGALACWDYAAAAPYVPISMRGKDAVAFSPHKFPGGPGSPGVLVIKRQLLASAVPAVPGGGTVFFVSRDGHRYLANLEEREEGGTPDIVGAARCAAALRVKERVGAAAIAARECALARRLGAALRDHPRITVLGPLGDRGVEPPVCLPVVSILVAAPEGSAGRFLHYNYVCALLNDLFGVQTRGGCMCAGPYGLSLLGISDAGAAAFERALLEDRECLRPGFTRISLLYAQTDAEVDYIAEAVRFVADEGWRLLPHYRWHHDTGEWRHHSDAVKKHRRWLTDAVVAAPGSATLLSQRALRRGPSQRPDAPDGAPYYAWALARAREAAAAAARPSQSAAEEAAACADLLGGAQELRWFVLPAEAAAAADGCTLPWQQRAVAPRALLAPEQAPAAAPLEGSPPPPAGGGRSLQELREALQRRGLSTTGVRQALERRLEDAERQEAELGPPPAKAPAAAPAAPFAQLRSALASGTAGAADWERCAAPERPAADPQSAAPPAGAGSPQREPEEPAGADFFGELCFDEGEGAGADPAAAAPAAPAARSAPRLAPSRPPAKLMRLMGRAMKDYGMLRDGDRVVVGLSGGKDSLTLLHALLTLQQKAPFRFAVAAITVDPLAAGYDPGPALVPYLQSLGVPYFLERQPIVEQAKEHMDPQRPSICAWCSRMKRGVLYTAMRREGYNVLALGQHLDDLNESFLMSALHNGVLRTQKAHYTNDAGDVRVIRPLCYVRERDCAAFARQAKLPVVADNCPACFQAPQERARCKAVLAQQEHLFPQMPYQLLTALRPLMVGALEPRNPNGVRDWPSSGAARGGADDEDAEACASGTCGPTGADCNPAAGACCAPAAAPAAAAPAAAAPVAQ